MTDIAEVIKSCFTAKIQKFPKDKKSISALFN